MNPLISIIIPVFNSEKYLEQCISSIIEQTYKNIEIIIINDCSTDNSLNIITKYANNDKRIKLINNPSQIGAGLSRNKGFEFASGTYIHFHDSDDWIEENTYEILVNKLSQTTEIDIIKFSGIKYDKKTDTFIKYEEPINIEQITNLQTNSQILSDWTTLTWDKLYSKNFLVNNNIRFNNHKVNEDVEFSLKALISAKNILIINKYLYNYRINNNNSITQSRFKHLNYMVDDVNWIKKETQLMEESLSNNLRRLVQEILFVNCFDAFYKNIINDKQLREYILPNINPELFEPHPYYRTLYYDLEQHPSIFFGISYKIKQYLKTNIPHIWKTYLFIKTLIKRCFCKTS